MRATERRSHCLPVATPRGDGGFTLLELVVVMGLLAGLLGLLVQLLASGGSIYQRGEEGRDLSDRALAIAGLCRDVTSRLEGPRVVSVPGESLPDARLLIHEVEAKAIPKAGERSLGVEAVPVRVQVVRSSVRLQEAVEDDLLDALRVALGYEVVDRSSARTDSGIDDQDGLPLDEPLAKTGRGELLLFAWPTDPDGVFLDLFLRERLTIESSRLEDELFLVELADPEDLRFDARTELQNAQRIAQSLLHFEVECWSQSTRSWTSLGEAGPRRIWDSARAGTLEVAQAEAFGFDLFPASLLDARDDLYPRFLRLTAVVSRGSLFPARTFLRAAVDRSASEVQVVDAEEVLEEEWIKVDAEWMRIRSRSGRNLQVDRGQRGTLAREHRSGADVRVGRQVQVTVPLHHGREGDV